MKWNKPIGVLAAFAFACGVLIDPAESEAAKKRGKGKPRKAVAERVVDPQFAMVVYTGYSGDRSILSAFNSEQRMYPASVTKVLTAMLAFDAIASGRIGLETRISFSAEAAREPSSKLGGRAGESMTLKNALEVMLTKSANDVARMIAERIGELYAVNGEDGFSAFIRMMNAKAGQLGMHSSHFVNAHGWHDPSHVTTAHDLIKMDQALVSDYRDRLPLFDLRSATAELYPADGGKARRVVVRATNKLVGKIDFGKTGYTRPAGSNLMGGKDVTDICGRQPVDAPREYVLFVVGGAPTSSQRFRQAERLVIAAEKAIREGCPGKADSPVGAVSADKTARDPLAGTGNGRVPVSRPEGHGRAGQELALK